MISIVDNSLKKFKHFISKYNPMKAIYLFLKPRKNQQLYVHIGMPKTGSSAIQAFLALNKKYLAKKGFSYPNHTGFKQAFQTSAGNATELYTWIKNENTQIFSRFMSKIRSKNVILSSEILYSSLREDPEKFSQFFSGYDMKIICYIREMGDLAESCTNQLIKNHNLVDYSNIENNIAGFNYYDCLLKASEFIDKDKIIVKKYANDCFYKGNIYADFMNIFMIELDDSVTYPEKSVNPSLNRDALEFRILLNKSLFGKQVVQLKYRLNSALAKYSVENSLGSSYKNKYLLLNPKIRENINSNHMNLKTEFMTKFFPDSKSKLFNSKPYNYKKYEGLTVEKLSKILVFIKLNDVILYNSLIDYTHHKLDNKEDKNKILTAINYKTVQYLRENN